MASEYDGNLTDPAELREFSMAVHAAQEVLCKCSTDDCGLYQTAQLIGNLLERTYLTLAERYREMSAKCEGAKKVLEETTRNRLRNGTVARVYEYLNRLADKLRKGRNYRTVTKSELAIAVLNCAETLKIDVVSAKDEEAKDGE